MSKRKSLQRQITTEGLLHKQPLFVQLNELYIPTCDQGVTEWRETARWIKYEETLEFGAERWGKPHVASLSFHVLNGLREIIETGVVLLDVCEPTIAKIGEKIAEKLVEKGRIDPKNCAEFCRTISCRHRKVDSFSSDHKRKDSEFTVNSLEHFYYRQQQDVSADMGSGKRIADAIQDRAESANSYAVKQLENSMKSEPKRRISVIDGSRKLANDCFSLTVDSCNGFRTEHAARVWRNLPENTESAILLVGSSYLLAEPTLAVLRLEESVLLEELEFPIPVKFLCLLLGPLDAGLDYHEIGRSLGTLLSQKDFCEVAYKATSKEDLVRGIEDFLNLSIVVPPGKWDKEHFYFENIKLKANLVQRQRKSVALERPQQLVDMIRALKLEQQFKGQKLDPLKRTGKWFGGMRKEVGHRFPVYKSDFTDGLNKKCITSVFYCFFISLIPAMTFGAILNKETHNWFGVKETLMATSFGGIIMALFSAQPLLLMGVTGPILIFERSLYMFAEVIHVPLLQLRIWAGLWTFLCCVLTVAFEGSFLIHYLTTFSEEIFSAMVSTIFIFQSIKFLTKIYHLHPVMMLPEYCDQNETLLHGNGLLEDHENANFQHYSGTHLPNTALISTILLFGTFLLAVIFRNFKDSNLLGRKVRRVTGNMSLTAAVVIMVLVDTFVISEYAVTSKLHIGNPSEPTMARPWVVSPVPDSWIVPVAALAAGCLYFFILFVEIEAGQILICAAKPGVQKGTGYHWDLIVSGFLAIFCSIFGLPWLCPAIVQSNEHVASLTIHINRAPGEKPEPVEILEQRVTAIVLNVLIGLSLLATHVINQIPVAVLFGAFLFIGYCNIQKLQLLARTVLFFIPVKHHPTTLFCIRVRAYRMHLFTIIQLIGLFMVVLVKKFNATAFAFPFAILLCVLVRQFVLSKIFSQVELMALDGEEHNEDED